MNYWNEINKLRKENAEISEQIKKLMAEQDQMHVHYKRKLFDVPELYQTYEKLGDNIDRLGAIVWHNNEIIEKLRLEYEESRKHDEYFRVMDEIDIRDVIGRDGFIIAVKF